MSTPELGWWRRRLLSDTFVSTVAAVVSTVAAFLVITFVFDRVDLPRTTRWLWGPTLLCWVGLSGLHALLTWLGYRGLGGEALELGVHSQRRRKQGFVRGLTEPSEAPGWSVTLATLAIIAVGGLVLTPNLRSSPFLMSLGLALVAVSWVNVVVVFAAQYARTDVRDPGLAFHGERERHFDDYMYLALTVQTSLSVSDVQIITRPMRRMVTLQIAIAFLFNTVLVAMAVSLVISRL